MEAKGGRERGRDGRVKKEGRGAAGGGHSGCRLANGRVDVKVPSRAVLAAIAQVGSQFK